MNEICLSCAVLDLPSGEAGMHSHTGTLLIPHQSSQFIAPTRAGFGFQAVEEIGVSPPHRPQVTGLDPSLLHEWFI